MAFVTPVVEHWLEREIAQWVHPMKVLFISATRAISFYHVTSINANNSNVVFTFVLFVLSFLWGLLVLLKKIMLLVFFVVVLFVWVFWGGFFVLFFFSF